MNQMLPRSKEELASLDMFNVRDIKVWYENYISFYPGKAATDVAVSLISNAQELMSLGTPPDLDDARKILNRAKWIIDNKTK